MTDEEQKARWFGLVQEWGASELSIQVFLKQRAISHSTFYRWRIRYEQEHLARLEGFGHQDTYSSFVEATFASAPDLVDGFSLEHPSGWRLLFSNGTHPDLIASILRGLACN
jgi:hypothetical protein